MTIDVGRDVFIPRPRAEVARFMFDAANDRRWIRAMSAVERLDDGEFGGRPAWRRERA